MLYWSNLLIPLEMWVQLCPSRRLLRTLAITLLRFVREMCGCAPICLTKIGEQIKIAKVSSDVSYRIQRVCLCRQQSCFFGLLLSTKEREDETKLAAPLSMFSNAIGNYSLWSKHWLNGDCYGSKLVSYRHFSVEISKRWKVDCHHSFFWKFERPSH